MRKKNLIITSSTFLLIVLLCIVFYFFYFKNVNIYEPINIKFPGISSEENSTIKIFGITPLNKKSSFDTNSHACYKTIEIDIPDALALKTKYISAIINGKMYTYKIGDLHSFDLSENIHTYILPPEVRSEGTFFTKLSASLYHLLLVACSILKIPFILATAIIIPVLLIRKSSFLRERKKYWLVPLIIILIILSVLIIFGSGNPITSFVRTSY